MTANPLATGRPELPIVLFDDGAPEIAPLTDLRPSFALRIGPLTTIERLSLAFGKPEGLLTPEAMAPIAREMFSTPVNDDFKTPAGGDVLAINGRCPLPILAITSLAPGEQLVDQVSGAIVAMRAPLGVVRSAIAGPGDDGARAAPPDNLIRRPWDARSLRDRAIEHDLAALASGPSREPPAHAWKVGDHPIRIDPSANIYPGVTLDAGSGAIIIDAGATIRPGATICGPAYIGKGSTVIDHAVIRAHTSVGPSCKVGGEVGGVVFQGFSNKAHDGYLGDSWVGEWVNLGAGTTNSNLLNTYAEIIARRAPGAPSERTGETFLGAIIGDHVKTAICTRIMTASVLHTGSMFAQTGAVQGAVAPFTWATDKGHNAYRFEKFAEVMRTVMARRGVTPSEAYTRRVEHLATRANSSSPNR